MKIIYLRDDDVYKKDKEFVSFFNWMISNKIKCSYSVIPSMLESNLIDFFYSNKKHIKYFDILQHGYSHKQNKKRIEFGDGVRLSVQKLFIKKGFNILKSKLSDFFIPVYVPPFHNYDLKTVDACIEAGIKHISASRKIYNDKLYKINFFYCDVNFNEYKNGVALPVDLPFLKRLTLEKIKKRKITGIYFHHNTFSKYNNMKKFIEYIEFLKKLEGKGIVKIKKISEII